MRAMRQLETHNATEVTGACFSPMRARAACGWLAVLPVQQTSSVLECIPVFQRVLHTWPNNERTSK